MILDTCTWRESHTCIWRALCRPPRQPGTLPRSTPTVRVAPFARISVLCRGYVGSWAVFVTRPFRFTLGWRKAQRLGDVGRLLSRWHRCVWRACVRRAIADNRVLCSPRHWHSCGVLDRSRSPARRRSPPRRRSPSPRRGDRQTRGRRDRSRSRSRSKGRGRSPDAGKDKKGRSRKRSASSGSSSDSSSSSGSSSSSSSRK